MKSLKTLSFLAILLCLFFTTVAPTVSSSERGVAVKAKLEQDSGIKVGTFRALIIGINDYQDEKIPDLQTAVNDAQSIARVLQNFYGFTDITVLLDREADGSTIQKSLRQIASSSKAEDSVLIYYAGHGDRDTLTDDGWWIPANAVAQDPFTYIDNTVIQKYVKAIQARHVLLVSDSCFSGTLFGSARSMPSVIDDKYYGNLFKERSRWGMTSGNLTPVSDSGSAGHSVFGYQFLKALSKNKKPYLTPREIYQSIAPIISNNSEQMPVTKPIRNTGDQGGEFIFIRTDVTPEELKVTPPLVPQQSMTSPEIAGKGDIYLESVPSGATVYLDREEKGQTPLELNSVQAGKHAIELRKGEIYSAKLEVDLEPNAFIKKKVTLEIAKGTVKITSDPSGTRIFLDYLDTGRTTPDALFLEAGKHELILKKSGKEGFRYYSRTISVEPDQKTAEHVNMRDTAEKAKSALIQAKNDKKQLAKDVGLAGMGFGPFNLSPFGHTLNELKILCEKAFSARLDEYSVKIEAALDRYRQRVQSNKNVTAAKRELEKRIKQIGSPAEYEKEMLKLEARQLAAMPIIWENELARSLLEAKKQFIEVARNDSSEKLQEAENYWNSHWERGGASYKSNIASLRKATEKAKYDDIKGLVFNSVQSGFLNQK